MSSSSLTEQEVDSLLGQAKSTWKKSIEQDERSMEMASERRLARAWRPQPQRRALAATLAYGVAIGAVGTLALTQAFPKKQEAIQPESYAQGVSAPLPAAPPAPPPLPSPAEPPPAPSTPVVPAKPAPVAAPPAKAPAVDEDDADNDVRVISRGWQNGRMDRRAVREASAIAKADLKTGRAHLRSLAERGDPAVAFDAWAALARTCSTEHEEIAVWDEAIRRLPEPYAKKARLERAAVLIRAGRTEEGLQETRKVIRAMDDLPPPPPAAPPAPAAPPSPIPPAAPVPPTPMQVGKMQMQLPPFATQAMKEAAERQREAQEAREQAMRDIAAVREAALKEAQEAREQLQRERERERDNRKTNPKRR